MVRSIEEVNQYKTSFSEFAAEINTGGVERFYNCRRNVEILRDALFALQSEQNLHWMQLWHKRLWGAVYAQHIAELEIRPDPKKKPLEVRQAELHARDRRDGAMNRISYREESEEQRFAREQKKEEAKFDAMQAAKAKTLSELQRIEKTAIDAQDIREHPGRHVPSELKAFDRDATQAEMVAMSASVLKYFLAQRCKYIQTEAQNAERDRKIQQTLQSL
jgi:hypothetical protein